MLDLLSSLVGKSLVTFEGAGNRRYRLLETVRHYARERHVETADVNGLRDRHFDFYFERFRHARTALQGHGQVRWLKQLHLERDNVRTALEWALSSPALAGQALELAGALFWYWTKRGAFAEGRQWLERSLAIDPDVRGSVRGVALIGLAHMLYFQGHFDDANAVSGEALTAAREAGDRWTMSFALFVQALTAMEQGDYDLAAMRATEAGARRDGAVGGPVLALGNIAMLRGDLDRAQKLFDEANDMNRRSGEIWGLGIGLLVAAGVRIAREDFTSATEHVTESLSLNEELEDPRGIAWSLEACAGLLAATGRPEAAVQLWAAAERLAESVGSPVAPFINWIRDRYIQNVQMTLGHDAFSTAHAAGHAMSPEEAIAFARRQAMSLR